MFRALLSRLAPDRLLPSQCAVCRAWPATPLCTACKRRFAAPRPRCRACALPVAEGMDICAICLLSPRSGGDAGGQGALDRCHAAVDYVWPWNDLISRYKFGPEPGCAPALAALMRATPGAAEALDEADALLPLPLTQARLRERGFNQALLLARELAPRKIRANCLLRLRHAPDQHHLPRAERLHNVQGAFGIAPGKRHLIEGQRLLLIDDVMTTGATLNAAAAVLREAGAVEVSALVLARTPVEGL
ncbi:phosphoribosyltransferase [Hylemonella gracilis str. Niagara R]|uniref:Phosphoribosyltransferase n=1 Tax=Hylemonella gracilis str. Niagara R TaxID=1458275 RepID=A0A016XN36_9BURK|nr:ComF family protein [Hylemonella gracilis]EYC52588.1 phosphoribosyltransferase [Hylemonella gracilis str. Niagara R]